MRGQLSSRGPVGQPKAANSPGKVNPLPLSVKQIMMIVRHRASLGHTTLDYACGPGLCSCHLWCALVTMGFPVGPVCPDQFMGGRVGTDYNGAGFVSEQSQISEGQAHGPPFRMGGWVCTGL